MDDLFITDHERELVDRFVEFLQIPSANDDMRWFNHGMFVGFWICTGPDVPMDQLKNVPQADLTHGIETRLFWLIRQGVEAGFLIKSVLHSLHEWLRSLADTGRRDAKAADFKRASERLLEDPQHFTPSARRPSGAIRASSQV